MTADRAAFLRDLFIEFAEGGHGDIEGGWLQDLLVKHGFAVRRIATEADCAVDGWCDYEPGETFCKYTDEMLRIMGLE